MEELKSIQKKYCSLAIFASILIGALFIGIDMRPIGKGIILGSLFSVLNFILIGRSLPGRILADKRAASKKSLGVILFRFIIMAVPLYIALEWKKIDFFATAAGLFSVQIMILGDHLVVSPIISFTRKRV